MSVPSLTAQRSFFDTDQLYRRLLSSPGAERFRFFSERLWPELVALRPRMEATYCATNGRPAEEPVRMLAALLLQFVERLPDRQAAEAATYDLRWKSALHLQADEIAFHPTSLVKFRQRLDSTHILGLVSAMSRLECMRERLRLTLESLVFGVQDSARPAAWALWWERYVESKLDYKAKVPVLKAKMEQTGADACALLAWVQDLALSTAARDAVELLRRVYAENFESGPQGAAGPQRPAQPAGAVHNPHDPEAMWCKKSTIKHKEWIG